MPAHKLQKLGFAVFFVVALLGAVLLMISQIPLREEGYDVIETRSFSPGEPLTFYWTFAPDVSYGFEVKGVNWTIYQSPYSVPYLSVEEGTSLVSTGGEPVEPPWVWYCSYIGGEERARLNVTVWHSWSGREIERATTPTFVEISEFKETTYQLTYLIYAGLPLLIISAILITIIGKDGDSRIRVRGNEKGW